MTGYLLRRIGQAIIVILGVTLIVFFLGKLIPGGQCRAELGPKATPAQLEHCKIINGFNQPIWVQYWHYLLSLLKGNLGYSYKNNQSVTSLIQNRLPKTIVLLTVSTVVALVIAVPLGIAQAVRRNHPLDYAATGIGFFLYAMPDFLIGSLLILLFSFKLHWFPSSPPTTTGPWGPITDPQAFVLPIATLAATTVALFSRYMRSSVLDTIAEDYVRTARAKGAGQRRVLYGHVLRNALLPLITILGLVLPGIVSGALIVEDVFNYPGMGLLAVNAAFNDDIPTVLGTTLVAAVFTVVGSLIADILYAAVDPRIRLEGN